MAIINMGSLQDRNKPGFTASIHSFTYAVWQDGQRIEGFIGPICLCTYLSHEGLCLRDYERNGYDDSDFHMIVWNEEKQAPEDICFASTRGWSYPCYGSWVDATEETKEKYRLWQVEQDLKRARQKRKERAIVLLKIRREAKEIAALHGVPHYRFMRLRHQAGYNASVLFALANLLTSKRIRNAFKLKLKAQVLAWLGEMSPKYPTPLSKRQLEWV